MLFCCVLYVRLFPSIQLPNQPGRYSEPDSRDWRNRPAPVPAPGEERSWETLRENKEPGNYRQQEENHQQYPRAQISSNQGVILYCFIFWIPFGLSHSRNKYLWLISYWLDILLYCTFLFTCIWGQFRLIFVLSWSQGGSVPALVKAEVPWSARRGTLSDKDRVLKTVKG